jgi:hypothetical protein
MRKFLILIATLGLVVAGCGGDSAGSCEGVADEAIEIFQDAINEIDEMSLEDLASGNEPEALVEMEERAESLQVQAEDLGCSDAEMEELINARTGSLTADGEFGQMLLEGVQSDGLF